MSYFPKTLVTDIYLALKSILNVMNRPCFIDPSTKRVLATAAVTGTLSTVTTVTTVANLTNINNLPFQRYSWALLVRRNIT